ncbi:damage-control phosphatase ARMT1 family protein [Hydrogenivirga sp.]
MKAYPQCVPCLVNQGLNAVRKLGLGRELEKEIALRSLRFLSQFDSLDMSPAYYASFIQEIVKELSGSPDPFREQKRLANRVALNLLKEFEEALKEAEDRLAYALRLSAVGNYIDFAIRGEFELADDIRKLAGSDFVLWDYEVFREKLEHAEGVLIIGDNAGEIAFDKPLVRILKEMGKDVVYSVKGEPILNDATMEDAEEVSMTKLCRVIDNGSDKVGTWLEDCSREFLVVFEGADIVISKGQANYETLSTAQRELFFLLVAKCEPIAQETGGEVRRFILKFKGEER